MRGIIKKIGEVGAMKQKENFGCIKYNKKNRQLVLLYSNEDGLEVDKLVLVNLQDAKIKNDYELMTKIYNTIEKSTKSIPVSLKKFVNCTKMLSEGKTINFKIEREAKKTYMMLPDLDNEQEKWVRIYNTTEPFGPLAKAALEYNKLIKEQFETLQK
jgi:uncharacterized protein YlbG (UPF0298 family)